MVKKEEKTEGKVIKIDKPIKQTAAKAVVEKKAATKKVAAKAVVEKKAATKKVAAKAVVEKKAATKKVAAKAVVEKKAATKKVAAKAVVEKKAATKKVAVKAVVEKKAATKKVVAKKVKLDEISSWVKCVVDAMGEKKGERIVSLDLRKANGSSFDYFVICEAFSSTHIRAVAEGIEEEMNTAFGLDPIHREGFANAEWILLDYGQIVAHVFLKDIRIHYKLEDLWADAEVTVYDEE